MDPSISDDIADDLIGLDVDLARLQEGTRERLLGLLYGLQLSIVARLHAFDFKALTTVNQLKKTAKLLAEIGRDLKVTFAAIQLLILTELGRVGPFTQDALRALLDDNLGGEFFIGVVSAVELSRQLDRLLVRGGSVAAWLTSIEQNLLLKISTQLRAGLTDGETVEALIERIRGRATGQQVVVEQDGNRVQVPQYTTGILPVLTKQVADLSSTATTTVAEQTMLGVYRANAEYVKGLLSIAVRDDRTTDICLSMDMGVWDAETHEPLPNSPVQLAFVEIPRHWLCRSTFVAVLYSWDELMANLPESRGQALARAVAEGRRADIGAVPARFTYRDWLNRQSDADQRDILGLARYQLWKVGKLSPSVLASVVGRALTLDQLRVRRGLASAVPA